MTVLDLTILENESLEEYAEWWQKQLLISVDKLLNSKISDYKQNFAAVIGILTLYNIYIDEMESRNILKYDEHDINSYLAVKDDVERKLEKLEDWCFGTERLRVPIRNNKRRGL